MGTVTEPLQAELQPEMGRTWSCPFCSTTLPDWPLDSYNWEHCDPRPPRCGSELSGALATKQNE